MQLSLRQCNKNTTETLKIGIKGFITSSVWDQSQTQRFFSKETPRYISDRITFYYHTVAIFSNHFTWHSSSRHNFPLTADINWEMLATQRAIHGAFICSSAPRTVPIKADNVIIKRADSKNCQRDTLIYQPLLFIKPLKLQCFHPWSVHVLYQMQ